MPDVALVTGGTGLIGREIVRCLLAQTDWQLCILRHRRGFEDDGGGTMAASAAAPSAARRAAEARIRIVDGDVTRDGLGMPAAAYRQLTAEVTAVLHGAASTRFHLPLAEARRTNVAGTRVVLELARRCPRLERFGLLSTVYVAGTSTGTIPERHGAPPAGFVNTYEQTKAEAERLVAAARSEVPAAIYRLSTLAGDSRTGRVHDLTAPHHALRVMYLGLASMIPGTLDCPVDLIPSDHTAAALVDLFAGRFAPGQVFHLAAGKGRSYTLAEIVDRSYAYLGEADPEWRRRRYPKPALVSARAFDLFLRSVEQTGNPLFAGVTQAVKHFALQLLYPKDFDRSRLLAVYPEYDRTLPHIDTYYRKVVHYCLRSNWAGDARR